MLDKILYIYYYILFTLLGFYKKPNFDWDNKINNILKGEINYSSYNGYTLKVGDTSVWATNYPYGLLTEGSNWVYSKNTVIPKKSTVIKFLLRIRKENYRVYKQIKKNF